MFIIMWSWHLQQLISWHYFAIMLFVIWSIQLAKVYFLKTYILPPRGKDWNFLGGGGSNAKLNWVGGGGALEKKKSLP